MKEATFTLNNILRDYGLNISTSKLQTIPFKGKHQLEQKQL